MYCYEYILLRKCAENSCIIFIGLKLYPKFEDIPFPALHIFDIIYVFANDKSAEKRACVRLVIGALFSVLFVAPLMQAGRHPDVPFFGLIDVKRRHKANKAARRLMLCQYVVD